MSVITVMNTAYSGMAAQEAKLSAVANNIANSETPGYRRMTTTFISHAPAGVQAEITQPAPAAATDDPNVDPNEEFAAMIAAQAGYKVNAAAFEAGADLWDVLATIKRD